MKLIIHLFEKFDSVVFAKLYSIRVCEVGILDIRRNGQK